MAANFLTEDLLLEILARLPVKSLLRFRSVAKFWKNILKEPTFITKHHLTQVASNRDNCVLTIFHDYLRSDPVLITEDEQGVKCSVLESPFFKDSCHLYLVSGQCNGLVLISNSENNDGDLFLWNPATRECKALPSTSQTSSLLWEKHFHPWSRFGFGIDPITKDYKVVRIWNLEGSRYEVDDRAEVLSLSANSCRPNNKSWKKIDSVPPLPISHQNDHVFLDGKYYWCTKSTRDFGFIRAECSNSIVWFDMGTEQFGFIEFPHPCSDWNRLGVLKETLAIVRHAYTVGNKDMYEIWIMDQRSSAWTKYATVGPFNQCVEPIGFGMKEALVVLNTCVWGYMHESFSYDIKTHVMKKIIEVPMDWYGPLAIYNESLVSVGGVD